MPNMPEQVVYLCWQERESDLNFVDNLLAKDKSYIEMPKDKSIKSVLLIGSGPVVISQACEFDYSGSQASKSLQEEELEVTLINSNPATIMTDPVAADHVY